MHNQLPLFLVTAHLFTLTPDMRFNQPPMIRLRKDNHVNLLGEGGAPVTPL
jgi:hypothetical protein